MDELTELLACLHQPKVYDKVLDFHNIEEATFLKMLNREQEKVIKELAKMEKGLLNGASLTFAVDNLVDTMSKEEKAEFVKTLQSLIDNDFLARHSERVTSNRVPFWLEFTKEGRDYCKRIS